ncbi:GNAT family N-acetyltransferase [Mobilitalea sibirica]|uniref:GNAT family N-acetyltransferase n=1 Tax=Mobilitalea sibirica TaxID=1462919 RepID=A0A8J7H1E7_9FIRM|nr:GNAT family N-acetyltransferase [Mobilitalea sibirica]MBH1942579.1 GNAT family N-acetyltransferase [Mobilitalea sibirica]
MLDKTLPYYNIIMKRTSGTIVPSARLPEGYTFKLYSDGDETHWADIMVSVGEFDSYKEALEYFQKEYLPHKDELKRRSLFIETDDGKKIGTLTNWWNYTQSRRDPSVHWVGVKPEYQGLGLGKAIVYEGMRRMIDLEGDRDYYLHTQTWSYKAITIYIKAGYNFVENETFGTYANDYDKALETIKDKLVNII